MVQFDPNIRIGSPENLPYDPEQDAAEKRDIRKKYRALEKSTGEQHTRAQEYRTEDLVHQVTQADSLFAKVKNPTEATLDSTVLRNVSTIGAQKARAMRLGSSAFDLDDFVSKLITFMGGRQLLEDQGDDSEMDVDMADSPLDWDKIGRKAMAKSRRVPAMGFMLGPLSIEQKKRNVAKRAKMEKSNEIERKPQEIREEDIQRSDNETTTNVKKIEKIINDLGEPVNIFRLVINPNDFAQSVENIFHLSFLVRDGHCSFEIGEDGEPVVWACEAPVLDDYSAGLTKQQMMVEFDMATWKRAIEVFDIRESMIPQRPPAKTKLGDKWYG
ncbi:Nse4 C-terminal-domain-containing protein [Hygrophoropsis aurantiaca]|uniref:Nse4 C-terminal-domain-containing protein n=1 Tax=Hygrophoropsis aurantiaca TaxID=72124 RepID=A0ACB8AS28_9AGAM|nr:Nse4 C-terminal-domain-containing protein [Hygrophoropsis aurantiaca]